MKGRVRMMEKLREKDKEREREIQMDERDFFWNLSAVEKGREG